MGALENGRLNTTLEVPSKYELQTTENAIAQKLNEINGTIGNLPLPTTNSISETEIIYKGPKAWRVFVEKWPIISQPLALLLIVLILWAIGCSILPDLVKPDSTIMRIVYLFIGAQLAGIVVTFLHLPDMLGMLAWGVFYTNIGLADFSGYLGLETFLREMALVNIMLLAGLGLDLNAFKKLWVIVMQLTLIPTVAEVVIIAVLAYFLLQMPWLWGFLLGLVVTAVSPNVVVTIMLHLKQEKLGLNKGIHTLIYAMTTCNDVVSIFAFGVLLGAIFSTGPLSEQLLQGPVGIGTGIVFGFLFGLMLVFVPSKDSKYVNGLRFVMTVLGGAIAVMGSKAIGYPSAGALGCVTISLTAGMSWKKQLGAATSNQQNESLSVIRRLDLLWKFLKPVSFALIGKEINFSILDGKLVGFGFVVILAGVLFRLTTSYFSTYGAGLTKQERAYITISGLPKATVQAALGPIALDLARSLESTSEIVTLASNVLIISVLAIILTAPIGAILMIRLAPIWLKHGEDEDDDINGGGNDNNGLPITITSSPDGNERSDNINNPRVDNNTICRI